MKNLQINKSQTLLGHEGAVYALEKSNAPGRFFSGGSDRIVCQWCMDGITPPSALVNVGAIVYSIRLVQEKSLLLIGTSAGNLHVVDLIAGKEIRNLAHHRSGIFDIQYSIALDRIFTASGDGSVAMWRLSDLALIRNIQLCQEKVRSLSIHPAAPIIAAACGDGSIRLLDAENGTINQQFQAHGLSSNAVIYDPAGERLFSGGRDAHLNVWDASTYQNVRSIPAHNYAIYSFAFSPDHEVLASASRDKTVKLWNAQSFEIISRLDRENYDGHRNSVNKVLWLEHPSGLVSAGDDRAIMLWTM